MCSTKSISLRKFALRSSCFRREDASVSAFNRSNARGITPFEKRREGLFPNFEKRKVRNSRRLSNTLHQRRRITTQSRKKNEKNRAEITLLRAHANREIVPRPLMFSSNAPFSMAFVTYTRNLKPGVSHARTGEEEVSFFCRRKGNKKSVAKDAKSLIGRVLKNASRARARDCEIDSIHLNA